MPDRTQRRVDERVLTYQIATLLDLDTGDGLGMTTEPADEPKREAIKERLDAFTEATRRFSEAVRNGARPRVATSSEMMMWQNAQEDREASQPQDRAEVCRSRCASGVPKACASERACLVAAWDRWVAEGKP